MMPQKSRNVNRGAAIFSRKRSLACRTRVYLQRNGPLYSNQTDGRIAGGAGHPFARCWMTSETRVAARQVGLDRFFFPQLFQELGKGHLPPFKAGEAEELVRRVYLLIQQAKAKTDSICAQAP